MVRQDEQLTCELPKIELPKIELPKNELPKNERQKIEQQKKSHPDERWYPDDSFLTA
jgi:hypothetical protein